MRFVCSRSILTPHSTLHTPQDFPQRQHGKEGNGELGNDQNRGYRPEFRIHRHIVDEEVCQTHEVLSPREHNGEDSGCQQSPLHRALHDKQAKDEKHHHKGSHIDGT